MANLYKEAGISPRKNLYVEAGIQPNVPRGTQTGFTQQLDQLRGVTRSHVSPLELLSDNPGEDVANVARRAGGAAIGAGDALPSQLLRLLMQAPSSAKNAVMHPINSARDLAGGVASNAQNLAATLGETGQFIGDLPLKLAGVKNIPKINIREQMGLEGDNQVDLGKMVSSENPDPLLYALTKYGLGSSAFGTKLLPLLAGGAVTAATQARPGERVEAATEGLVGGALPIGAVKGLEHLRPSVMFRGKLSPEELQQNLQAAQGSGTNLGKIVESPTLNRMYENILPHVPFSSGYESMQETASQIKNTGLDLMKDLGISTSNKIKSQDIVEALKESSKTAKKEKIAKYSALNKAADDAGVVVPRENLSATASSILEDIKNKPELSRKIPKEVIDDLKHYATNKEATSLETADKLKGILNIDASKHFKEGNDFLYGYYKSLADSLEKDSESALDSSSDINVQNLRKEARDYYKNVYQPTRSKEILALTRKNANPYKALKGYLTKDSDSTQLLDNLQKVLSLKQQELMPTQFHLGRSLNKSKQNPRGGFDPRKLAELYSDLSEEQAATLIPDINLRNRLNNFQNLAKMNDKSLNTMFNPPTGQTGLDYFMKGAAPLAAASAGGALAGPIGAALGYAGGLVVPGLVSRPLIKGLTSEKVRENLIKTMIENKKKFDTEKKKRSLSALSQAMSQQGMNNNVY